MTESLEEMTTTVPRIADGHDHDPTTHLNVTNGAEVVGKSAVAGELCSLISSVVTDFHCRAEATDRSQEQLASALDRLTGELDKLLEDAPSPFIMQQAARISGVRNRVKALNTVLKSIQRRIDNMDLALSAGVAHAVQLSVQEGAVEQSGLTDTNRLPGVDPNGPHVKDLLASIQSQTESKQEDQTHKEDENK